MQEVVAVNLGFDFRVVATCNELNSYIRESSFATCYPKLPEVRSDRKVTVGVGKWW